MSQHPCVRVTDLLFRKGQPLGGVLIALIAALLAWWARYGLIEPASMGNACEQGELWWCAPRAALITATKINVFGIAALLSAALMLLPVARFRLHAAYLTFVCGGVGLVLYNASFSAVALVLAVLLLAVRRENTA
ncbi:MAG: hypothetical protein WD075_02855 [Rhodospirillales bacterium]